MFQPTPSSGAGSKGSAFHRAAGALGTAIGIGAAILLTPLLYQRTRAPLLEYLNGAYGAKLGAFLTSVFGGVEGAVILFSIRLLFISLLIWAFTAIGRRFT